jgi:hypothetical protein
MFIQVKYQCKDYLINPNHIIDIIKKEDDSEIHITINITNTSQQIDLHYDVDSDNLEEGKKFYLFVENTPTSKVVG